MKSKYGLSFDRNLKGEEKWKSVLQSTSEDQKFWWAAKAQGAVIAKSATFPDVNVCYLGGRVS